MSSNNRGKNWSHDEMAVLVEEVNKRKGDLFGKFSNNVSKQDKDRMWDEITCLVNSVRSDVVRTTDQVERKLVQEKSQSKRKVSEYSSHMGGTGGGPPKPGKPPSDLDYKFASLCTEEEVHGIGDSLDSNRPPVETITGNSNNCAVRHFSNRSLEEQEYDLENPPSSSSCMFQARRSSLQSIPQQCSSSSAPRSGSVSLDSFDISIGSPSSAPSPVPVQAKQRKMTPSKRGRSLSVDTEKTIMEIEQERLQLARESLDVQREILGNVQQLLQVMSQLVTTSENSCSTLNTLLAVQLQSSGITVISEDQAREGVTNRHNQGNGY